MAFEVEIKAWIADWDKTEQQVREIAKSHGGYVKEDVYFNSPGYEDQEGIQFRFRQENERWICTHKNKQINQGIEVNDEQEFEVLHPKAFEGFLYRLGCREFIKKKKTGHLYRKGAIGIELSHVDNLGDFIEIEEIVDSEDQIEAARQRVKNTLRDCGILEENIEPRTYTAMLLAKQTQSNE